MTQALERACKTDMKALVKRKAEVGLWLEDVPVPTIGINDVLIEVVKTSICGTDVHIYNWDAWAQKTIKVPMTIGHEFVGRIVELGSNVHDFHVGDLVAPKGTWSAAGAATAWPAGGICATPQGESGSTATARSRSTSPCR
jgi:D-arabinose 1-dehydrogenase-like Zn-dependent alcohol dehydrogenase